MSKALIVAGGFRIGDTWHLIPMLRKLALKHDSITWITGRYAQEASRFLALIPSLKIKELIIIDEYRRPGDISDREKFVSEVFKNDGRGKDFINPADYDEVITDVRCSFEIAFNYNGYIGNYPELTTIELPFEKKSEHYICVQPDSISKQKTFRSLENIDYPLKSYTIGLKDELLVFKSLDKREIPYSETIKLLYQSRFNVCIHSSFACASFYLNKPTIIIHFFNGQFRFGKYHENCFDLIAPSGKEIEQAMKVFAEKYK
jgi:hypothetical protein